MGLILRRQKSDRGGRGNRSEDLGFAEVEVEAEWGAKGFESMKEKGKVCIWEKKVSVVEVGGGVATMRAALATTKLLIKRTEKEGKDKAGKEWA